jgi:uncharacterized protein YodC (DUF2158 family)
MTFKVGDTVILRSGGPRMTVESNDGDAVKCVWFEKTKAHRGTFPSAALAAQQPRSAMVGTYSIRR